MTKYILYIVLLVNLLQPFGEVYCNTGAEQYSKVSVFYLHNSWKEKADNLEDKLSAGVFGIKLHQFINPQLTFDLAGTFTSSSYSDLANNDVSFSSLNDTRIKGTYYLPDHKISASLMLNLPTGKKKLSDEQYLIAVGLADNSRKFAVHRFGQGLEIGGEVLFLPEKENTNFQIGGGYILKSGYQVLEAKAADYKFGNEFYFKAGVKHFSEPISLRGSLFYRIYGKDEFDSKAVYQSGNTLQLGGRLSYADFWRASVGLNLVIRGKAKIAESGSDNLTEEALKSGRNEFLLYANGSRPLNEKLRLLGRLEVKNLSANDYTDTLSAFRPKANYIGIGAGLGHQFSLAWSGSFVATYYTGKIDENDLIGFGLAAAITFRYWRE